jgi:hypothetical protein
MKTLTILFSLIVTNVFAQNLSRTQIEQLLLKKNIKLSAVESLGSKLLIGEVTGAGRGVPMSKIQAFITHDRAILSSEIDSIDAGVPSVLSNLSSLRFEGNYILSTDLEAVLIKP